MPDKKNGNTFVNKKIRSNFEPQKENNVLPK